MDSNEAIKRLRSIKQVKKQGEDNNQSNTFAKGLMNFKNIIVGAMSDLTGLILANEPSVKVLNFPKKDKTEKLLTEINKHLIKIEQYLVKCHTNNKR